MSVDEYVSIINSIVALVISIIALIFTIKAYLLKAGESIRGSYVICTSITCEDQYVSSFTLENLKDRAIIIFKVYLKLGHNYYIMLEEFEEEPLILKPFEVFKKEYDPIDLYSVSSRRILLNNLFENKSIKKQLVLSTTNGKYSVKTQIERWDPIVDFFNNHMTAVIYPSRSTYEGKAYGLNAKYIVEFKAENGKKEVVAIYPGDYRIKKFRRFNLTKESLESKEALIEFLYFQSREGLLNYTDIEVRDMDEWRNEIYQMENKEIVTASYYNWFKYRIMGRVFTVISDYKLRKKNKESQKKSLLACNRKESS